MNSTSIRNAESSNKITDPETTKNLPHKFLAAFGIIWISFFIINTLTSFKVINIYGAILSVGTLTYPVTYIFSDIFTEVYGYRVSRKVVWTGFLGFLIVSIVGYIYSIIPGDASFSSSSNDAFNTVFKFSPLLVLISLCAFPLGELTNSFVLAKLKIFTVGKFEEFRYITSTLLGQTVDNTIFYLGTFFILGWYTFETLPVLIATTVSFCTFVEFVMLPLTKKIIRHIKEKEGIDTYDHGANFNPFKL